jgi:hypothetical protein
MSKRYPGNFITGNPVAVSQTSNTGVWDLKDQYQATGNNTWQEVDGIYEIQRSLRFRGAATAYLNRTTATGNAKTWTFSAWIKRCNISSAGTAYRSILCAYSTGNTYSDIAFAGTNQDRLRIYQQTSGADTWYAESTVYFRDPSAWYHIVVAFDDTLATSQDRIKLYVNGVRQIFASYTAPAQSTDYLINSSNVHWINYVSGNTSNDMYLAETNFIDGQGLDSSYFGYFDPITNNWQPKKYTGGYGTTGYYLPFSENMTLKNLGRNFAGNTNFCPYSESVNSWGNTNCTITSNSVTAPNGTLTADTVTANSTAAAYMRQDTGINMGISTYYTMSVYFKAGTATTATLSDGYGTGAWVTYDLTNGVVTAAYNPFGYQEYTITAVSNGWYRATNSFITHSGGDYNIGLRVEPGRGYGDTGASGASVYVWGAQINLGKTADAYFPNDVSTRADSSWTLNNISVTAGATYDSMVDSPVNVFTSATDVGGVVSGNYCTFDPKNSNGASFTNGNLTINGGNDHLASMGVVGGKWYWEATRDNGTETYHWGIYAGPGVPAGGNNIISTYVADADLLWMRNDNLSLSQYANNGVVNNITQVTAPQGGVASGDTLGFQLDLVSSPAFFKIIKNNTTTVLHITFTYNSTSRNAPIFPYARMNDGCVSTFNFGQRAFTYTPPAGFKSINTTNLQALGTPSVANAAFQPTKWFDIVNSAGSTIPRRVSGLQMQPDLVLFKNLDGSTNRRWSWFDSVRGPNAHLTSQLTAAEVNSQSDLLTSFTSDGFTVGADAALYGTNGYNERITQWCWKQSPSSGFNIVPYTGTGSTMTISHNLGTEPKFIIIKDRTAVSNWVIQHHSLGWTKGFLGFGGVAVSTTTAFSNNTAPTSSNFTVDAYSNGDNTGTRKYIAYLWADIPGFCKFGSHYGAGGTDTGTFVYTGFKPSMVWIKRITGNASEVWVQCDSKRTQNVNNPMQYYLSPDLAAGENTSILYDFTSNGFKFRNSSQNEPGSQYIYAAWAESPFALNNRAK